MLVAICPVAVRWRLEMLENIQRGDICIFQNGEEATVINFNPDYCGSNTIRLFFNKEVRGGSADESVWNYYLNGKWIGNGNNIVKVIHR